MTHVNEEPRLSYDARDEFIRQTVKGRSFAEVGGLWGTVNEKVSVAHFAGASSLTMIDVTPQGRELWQLFNQRIRDLGVPAPECISADVCEMPTRPERPVYDVVHCSGILYHIPDPVSFLLALRKITRRHLVLTSAVTGTMVEGAGETLHIPESTCLFVPALAGRERAIVRSYWEKVLGDGAIGLTQDLPTWRPDNFAPWWWLPTVEALKAMCATVGFTFERGAPTWNGNAYTLLLSARPQ